MTVNCYLTTSGFSSGIRRKNSIFYFEKLIFVLGKRGLEDITLKSIYKYDSEN